MKVLNINSYYFSSSIYQPMEKELINLGIDISTYVPVHKNFSIRREISEKAPNYVDVSICYSKVDRYFYSVKHHKIKKDFLKRYDFKEYDILHAHSLFSNGYIAYLAYRKYNIPYIVAVRSTDIEVFFKKMPHLRKLGVEIMKEAQKIIFISPKQKEFCLNKYIPSEDRKILKQKTTSIPNGIDRFWFENKKVQANKIFKEDIIKLIFVGDDSERKNLKTVIKVCDLLINEGWRIELNIVGRVEKKKLLKKIHEERYINFYGLLNKADLWKVYRESEIFVMASTTETFGLVYVEALTQSLPIIYTKNQGFDGQIENKRVGYPVDCYKKKNIKESIIRIIEEYELLSRNSLEEVDKFKWENVAAEYAKIYHQIK